MAPILEEMENRIRGALGGYTEVLSYVDDIQVRIYDAERSEGPRVERKEMGEQWLTIADTIMKEVGREYGLPLEDDKHERLVLGCPVGRKKKRGRKGMEQKWIKWLGIIFDENLDFEDHWSHRIATARYLIGAIGSIGYSRWGMSPR